MLIGVACGCLPAGGHCAATMERLQRQACAISLICFGTLSTVNERPTSAARTCAAATSRTSTTAPNMSASSSCRISCRAGSARGAVKHWTYSKGEGKQGLLM